MRSVCGDVSVYSGQCMVRSMCGEVSVYSGQCVVSVVRSV